MAWHTCHAPGCSTRVPPRLFMCGPHWKSLRKPIRDAIWHEYRLRQEIDKTPSMRYMAVQRRALAEIVFKPNDEQAAAAAAPYLYASELYRQQAIADGDGDPLEGL